MAHIKINVGHAAGHISGTELETARKEALRARQTLAGGTGRGNDFLGWVDLPEQLDAAFLGKVKAEAARLARQSRYVVVVGIGGSYLGARMVIEALQSEFAMLEERKQPLVLYAGHTLGEDYYAQLLNIIDHDDYSVIVISKSGTTTEPAVAFRLLKAHLEAKYGHEGAVQRIVAVTDAHRGALHDIAAQEGYPMYVIPDNVGGRFSVLTPVGLLPIAAAGYDIDRLVEGARDMRKVCLGSDSLEENPALMYAAVRNVLYNKGVKVEFLVSCLPNLRYLAEWWKQLYGESEGKEHRGLLPHSLSITTDLHSMGQYVQEGERLMMETFVRVRQAASRVALPHDEQNLDGINYLVGKSITDINHCAAEGTIAAHESGGVPVVELEVERMDEYTLGALIYFFEFACGVSGYMLGVNPFDQPGVEAYKRNMFHLLGKPGF